MGGLLTHGGNCHEARPGGCATEPERCAQGQSLLPLAGRKGGNGEPNGPTVRPGHPGCWPGLLLGSDDGEHDLPGVLGAPASRNGGWSLGTLVALSEAKAVPS